jgi:pimeloyl-ACP methyl ester carboxylesterase
MNKIKNIFLLFEIVFIFSPVSVIFAEIRANTTIFENNPVVVGTNKILATFFGPFPTNKPVSNLCCSSILFLPGFEGSYLYKPESLPLGLGNITNTLWLPNRNDDARKLFLNESGSSTDPSIYSGSPISKAFGFYGVYGKFMDFLDNLVRDRDLNEWKSFAYDWRKPIEEVVLGPEKKATTTEYLIGDIEKLASQSKTGKVTIIAHSNGGLVAKYLVKTLQDIDESNLIDSVISVAVPYLGTPEAITSILHGDGQSIGYGLLLSGTVARQLGINMPSAYSLLPSTEYFSQLLSPTIVFASSSVSGINDGSYPMNIQSGSDQLAFITDSNNTRMQPVPSDTASPIKGNKMLSLAADALHLILDQYSWPIDIIRWAIVGFNSATTKNVNYYTETECKRSPSLPTCKSFLAHNASTTIMGDGTVVAKSAAYEAGKIASVDLANISSEENSNISHVNILESKVVQNTIEGMIKHNSNTDSFQLSDGVSWGEPDYSKDNGNSELVISTHSPVELHVYDDKGNHTGIIPNPTGQDIEEGLYTFFEEKIPNSHFKKQDKNGNGSDDYITLPDNGKKYGIVVQGISVGDFTLDIERRKDGAMLDHIEYNGIPVTPLTVASTTIAVIPFGNSSASALASSSKPLLIDVDGNGSPDIQANSGLDYKSASFDWVNYLEVLKKTIISLIGNTNKATNLNKRIDKLENLVKKGKAKQTQNLANKLAKKIGHKNFKELNETDKQQITDMINTFIAQYE